MLSASIYRRQIWDIANDVMYNSTIKVLNILPLSTKEDDDSIYNGFNGRRQKLNKF